MIFLSSCVCVCSGATNYSQWFEFLGTIKDKRFPPTGAPFQMNFPPQQHTPGGWGVEGAAAPRLACTVLKLSSAGLTCAGWLLPDGPGRQPWPLLSPPCNVNHCLVMYQLLCAF
jgi:Niemann-Pick C1 protein